MLKNIFWGIFIVIFWGSGMHKSKVVQNPKICSKPFEFFDLSILCALKVHFLMFTISKGNGHDFEPYDISNVVHI